MAKSNKAVPNRSKQTPRVEQMTDLELGWLAGWLEGEGSFAICAPYKSHPHPMFLVCAKSADRDVIESAQRITGVGRIKVDRNYSRKNPNWKDQWSWTVAKRDHVRLITKALLPHLHERRRARALELLAAMDKHEAGIRRWRERRQNGERPLPGFWRDRDD